MYADHNQRCGPEKGLRTQKRTVGQSEPRQKKKEKGSNQKNVADLKGDADQKKKKGKK